MSVPARRLITSVSLAHRYIAIKLERHRNTWRATFINHFSKINGRCLAITDRSERFRLDLRRLLRTAKSFVIRACALPILNLRLSAEGGLWNANLSHNPDWSFFQSLFLIIWSNWDTSRHHNFLSFILQYFILILKLFIKIF